MRLPKLSISFVVIVLAMLPAVLDQTILATALPTIARDLGSLADVSWVVSAYVVASAATIPVWGKLGDRVGRRFVLEASLALFLAASAVCGLAGDMTALIAARAVQGAAAGGLMTLAMAAVGDLVSPRERARYQGYIAAVFALATVAGPLLGGLLTEQVSWRWVFYVNLPLGLAALTGLRLRFPAVPGERPAARFDYAGALLLASATCTLMLICIWGGSKFAWGSAEIVGLGAALLAGTGALVWRERRAADPAVPLDLLRVPTVALASAAFFLITASLFAVTVFAPVFLQAATGATPTRAGLLLVAMMIGVTASTNFAGRRISRGGRYRRYPLAGLTLMAAGLAGMAALVGARSQLATVLCLGVFGLGFGMVGQILTVIVQNGVDRSRLGTAMATTNFFRALGGAVGAAVLGAVFASEGGVVPGVRLVFGIAAPLALAALGLVWRLEEAKLGEETAPPSGTASGEPTGGRAPVPSRPAIGAVR
ncbi:MAG: MFS transporter [Actinobacteria bacterium]|nr:MFS transporter [Actinomycetota bacterium]